MFAAAAVLAGTKTCACVRQRGDMRWLMGVGARADRWRDDGVECSSDRPGRVVWLGEQMAAFPSTKIAKPTRCNRTEAAVGRLSRVFPTTTATSVSAHTLIRMPATRCRTLRTGASRAGGGNRVAASVRGQSAVERLHCCDHGKLQQRLAIFPGLAITVTRLGVAGNSNGLTYESAGKKWRSKAELRKASLIGLLPDSRHNPVLLWEANHTYTFSNAVQWAKGSRLRCTQLVRLSLSPRGLSASLVMSPVAWTLLA